MNKKNNKLLTVIFILIIINLIILCINPILKLAHNIFLLVLPVILGFVCAFILNPLVKKLEKKFSHKISLFLSFIIFIVIIFCLIIIIIPYILNELISLFENLPSLIDMAESKLLSNNINISKIINFFNKYFDFEEYISTKLIVIEEVGLKLIKSIFSILLILVLTIIISAYILIDFDNIVNWLKEKTKDKKYQKIRLCLAKMKELMYSYISGVLVVFVFMFIISSLMFWLIGLDYWVVLGLIFAITNLIPYVGPYIGGIFAVTSGITVSIQTAILSFIIVVFLQLFENYFLTPKIQSKKLNIKPFYLLITIILMGKLLGIFGMLISIPVLSLFQTIFDVFILKKSI
ncbi:MAG: AI-2E family transporter [Bacilli bacterium]|nr:AI-2E family transporter [Bacilli bacterium]